MITLEQQIQELQAELRGCYLTSNQRTETEAELAETIAKQSELERELDGELDILCRKIG
jgi:hypothetical protein